MDYAGPQKRIAMTCRIEGCAGEYEASTIMHTARHKGQVVVIDHVPADVCSLCGDALLKPDTIRKIEGLLQEQGQPANPTSAPRPNASA